MLLYWVRCSFFFMDGVSAVMSGTESTALGSEGLPLENRGFVLNSHM